MAGIVRPMWSAAWAAFAVVVCLAGCTDAAPDPTPSTTTTTPAPVTPTPTPTPSAEDVAAERAEEVLRAYMRAQTDCLTDPPNTDQTCFDDVAIGTELTNLRNALVSAQSAETRVVGEIVVASLELRSIDLTSDLAASPPVVPTVVFAVCADVTNYDSVDKDGASVVPTDRPDVVPLEVSVYDYEYPDPAQWRVGYVVSAEDLSCGA